MNLSFAGCGFMGIYHIGVAVCFRQYAPQLLLNKISGASAGAIAACSLLCDVPLDEITTDILKLTMSARKHTLGPFNPKFNVQNIFRRDLAKCLPEDCHKRVNGKLFISLTRARDGKNVIISQYNSKKELIDALLATIFIPIFSGFVPPKLRGVRYLDGGFSDNLPTLDENTITVSPFCGESDICPRDDSYQLFHINVNNTSIQVSKQNMYRCLRILYPPHPEALANICKQGFDDALRFLHKNDLINCNSCSAIQITFITVSSAPNTSNCSDCKILAKSALSSDMPLMVKNKFRDAIETANKGLINRIFRRRSVQILCLLTLPYTLPIDILYAIIIKFLENLPSLGNSIWSVARYLLEYGPKIMSYATWTTSHNSAHIVDGTIEEDDDDDDDYNYSNEIFNFQLTKYDCGNLNF